MTVLTWTTRTSSYGYRMDGPFNRGRPAVRPSKVLLDPYARANRRPRRLGRQPDWNDTYQHRGRLTYDDFDWMTTAPEVPMRTW